MDDDFINHSGEWYVPLCELAPGLREVVAAYRAKKDEEDGIFVIEKKGKPKGEDVEVKWERPEEPDDSIVAISDDERKEDGDGKRSPVVKREPGTGHGRSIVKREADTKPEPNGHRSVKREADAKPEPREDTHSDRDQPPEVIRERIKKRKAKEERKSRRVKHEDLGLPWDEEEERENRRDPNDRDHTPPPRVYTNEYIAPTFRVPVYPTAEENDAMVAMIKARYALEDARKKRSERAREERRREEERRERDREERSRRRGAQSVGRRSPPRGRYFRADQTPDRRSRSPRSTEEEGREDERRVRRGAQSVDRRSPPHWRYFKAGQSPDRSRSPRHSRSPRRSEYGYRDQSSSHSLHRSRSPLPSQYGYSGRDHSPAARSTVTRRRTRSAYQPSSAPSVRRSRASRPVCPRSTNTNATIPDRKPKKEPKKEEEEEGDKGEPEVRAVRDYVRPEMTPFNQREREWITAAISKRPGDYDDPIYLDRGNPTAMRLGTMEPFFVHSDDRNARVRAVLFDPTYGAYQLEAHEVEWNEKEQTKDYTFNIRPTMYGPHLLAVMSADYFFVHSFRVHGRDPNHRPPQRRGNQSRPRLPHLDVLGVPAETGAIFHAPRPRRANEKHVDVAKVLQRFLGDDYDGAFY